MSQNVNSKDEIKNKSEISIFSGVFEAISLVQTKINSKLVNWFEAFGVCVARQWTYFIIIPFLVGCIAITGLRDAKFDNDVVDLSLPVNGRWSVEKKAVDKYFPSSSGLYFDITRTTSLGSYINIIVRSSEDGGNILTNKSWSEIREVDKIVTEKTVYYKGHPFTFKDICAVWKGGCFSPLFPIRPDYISNIESFIVDMSFVELENYNHFVNFSLQLSLGAPKYEDGTLISAEALSLFYALKHDYVDDIERAKLWEYEIVQLLGSSYFSTVNVTYFATRTPADEMHIANEKMKPLLALSGCLMVTFASICAIMKDAVRSKVLLSLAGIVSVVIATGSAFGTLLYLKIPFVGINYAAVFIMLGIGIDDMFVFLAAWRLTPLKHSVEERMKKTYGQACISVSITSITNVIAFSIGIFTDIRTIQIFSYYACLSSFLTYCFFLTFFGGVLAALGHLEKAQKHSVFFCDVLPKSLAGPSDCFHEYFMTGGIDPTNPDEPEDNEPHAGMVYIRDSLGKCLENPVFRGAAYLSYAVYIAVAIVGVTSLEQELHPNRIAFLQSTIDYFRYYDRYFVNKPSFAQIVFTEDLDYSNPETREKILRLHENLEHLPFVKQNLTTSWMRDWYETISKNYFLTETIRNEKDFVKEFLMNTRASFRAMQPKCKNMMSSLMNLTVSELMDKKTIHQLVDFLTVFTCDGRELLSHYIPQNILRKNEYVSEIIDMAFWVNENIMKAMNAFEMDIRLDEKLEKISASRFLIVIENGSNVEVQESLRKIVEDCGIPGVFVFNHQSFNQDQVLLVKSTTIISIIVTTIIVLLISFLFIPNIFCSLWVAFTIVSIEVGVVGFMALWNVKLNAISMVNLVMCVGFSVDFSAHMSYAFLSSQALDSKERMREALYHVGLPIIFGGASTVLGVLPTYLSNSSVFITFFKIVILIVCIGMVHALVYLPLFMSHIDFKSSSLELHPNNNKIEMGDMCTLNSVKSNKNESSIEKITDDNP